MAGIRLGKEFRQLRIARVRQMPLAQSSACHAAQKRIAIASRSCNPSTPREILSGPSKSDRRAILSLQSHFLSLGGGGNLRARPARKGRWPLRFARAEFRLTIE